MRCHKPQQTYKTTDGLTLVIVPRPSLLGVILDGDGTPKSVKYPDRRYDSQLGYRTFSDIKGIDQADYALIKPDVVLYELGDGTYLQADPELFVGSKVGSHNAASDYQPCFIHDVNQLKVVSMPELKEVPVYDLW